MNRPTSETFLEHVSSFLSVVYVELERLLSSTTRTEHPKPNPMSKVKPVLVLGLFAVSSLIFYNFTETEAPSSEKDKLPLPTEDFSPSKRNGKILDAEPFPDVYNLTPWEEIGFPHISEELSLALQHQLHVLEKGSFKDGKSVAGLDLTYGDMEQTIKILLERKGIQPEDLHHYLEAHQVWGKDKKGSVYFTGYFTPVLKVKKHKTEKYKYPIYAYPKNWEGRLPTRAEIDGEGALEGLGLELGYAAHAMDVYTMQLQGSGYVEYIDTGERYLFRFAGDNKRNYRNIQRFFKERKHLGVRDISFTNIRRYLNEYPEYQDSVLFSDRSYTFFARKRGLVKGAAEVPLMKTISIAADPDYFPAGSVLLAAMPVVEDGRVIRHDYTILLPQDVGGAIKGSGHVDVYCGVGKAGRKRASNLHHFGRMWLLKPKTNEQIAETLAITEIKEKS